MRLCSIASGSSGNCIYVGSIAKEHMGDEYDTVDDYIDEVCETNHIYDRQITDGMYLVIPYYTVRR